jgi:hypothetical protein
MPADDALSRLSAGLTRDEQLARAAIKDELPLPIGWRDPQVAARWKYSEYDDGVHTAAEVRCLDMNIQGARNAQKRHIAEHDPARVLRQVEAIRQALADSRVPKSFEAYSSASIDHDSFMEGVEAATELFTSALASIYTETPDDNTGDNS